MRKILIVLVTSLVLLLSGCANDVKSNPNGIKLTLSDEVIKYMPYSSDEIPYIVLFEDLNLNTVVNSKFTFQEVLSGNDDFVVSDAIAGLFTKYQDNLVVKVDNETVSATSQLNRIEIKDGKRKVIREKLPVDPEEYPGEDKPLSVVYDEVAFIMLENGLQLTLEYRRFTSNNKTYYVWRYTRSIMLYLHYPLMVYKNDDGNNMLVILPLPNYTRYSVGPQLTLKKLINEDTYLKEDYYTFSFDKTKKDDIINYYINRHQGVLDGEQLTCTYLGIDFLIRFQEESFKIEKL